MAAKSKKSKVEKEEIIISDEDEAEQIIEVKTSKKKSDEEKGTGEIETEVSPLDVGADKPISSFSQLDSDKDLSEDKEEEEVESEKVEEKEEEPPNDNLPEEEKPVEEAKEEINDWTPGEEEVPETEEKPSKTKFLLIIFVVAIIGLIIGGVFYYRSKVNKPKTTDQPEPSPVAEITPTPTEEPSAEEIDFSEYTVSILNGSGIPGEAGKVEKLIADLGFESIETGNAESYDYEATELSAKKDLPDAVISEIENLLGDSYEIERAGTSLAEDSTYDVIIIVGVSK